MPAPEASRAPRSLIATTPSRHLWRWPHYLCEGEREQLTKLWFYGSTLLAFHAGAVWSWLAVKWLDVRGVWGVLPQLALAYYLVLREEQAERVLTPAQIREQEVLGEAEELVEEAEELVEEEKED